MFLEESSVKGSKRDHENKIELEISWKSPRDHFVIICLYSFVEE